MENRCPYCKEPLTEMPKEDLYCPHCHEDIYVRYGGQQLFMSSLLTHEQVRVLEMFGRLKCRATPEESFSVEPDYTLVTAEDYHQMSTQLLLRFRRRATAAETVWHLAKKVAAECHAGGGYPIVYKDMVDFAYEIEQNHLPAQKKYHELTLSYWKRKGYKSVILLPHDPHCCENCLGVP